MKRIRIEIPNVTCADCRDKIETSVIQVEGVVSVLVDVTDKYADVTFSEVDTDAPAILKAVKAAGYKVRRWRWLESNPEI